MERKQPRRKFEVDKTTEKGRKNKTLIHVSSCRHELWLGKAQLLACFIRSGSCRSGWRAPDALETPRRARLRPIERTLHGNPILPKGFHPYTRVCQKTDNVEDQKHRWCIDNGSSLADPRHDRAGSGRPCCLASDRKCSR